MSPAPPTSAEPIVLGVRHHSPACARLVGDVVRAARPRFVLIEGPAEMNGRVDELLLGHELPIALYSYLAGAPESWGRSRGAYSPFCAYSPEFVALEAARDVGAEALFIDLPSYDDVFMGVENRYSDHHLRASDRMGELCQTLGFEDTDSLWDHLFEGPSEGLRERLRQYFVSLRGDEPGGPRDEPRESFMARWMAHAMSMAAGAPVVVVCGGYHAPALERAWREAPIERPALPAPPEGSRVGTYLVPYSFRRLDAFTGYQSGMPSPAYYQAVWERGARAGAEHMLRTATERLRAKRQLISSADLIGASTMTEGLTRIRGHLDPLRVDVLDGLAAALLKDAVSAPLPWTQRGPLASGTDPMLVEIVTAFSGERHGRLAPSTPRPPLVADAFAELASVGVEPTHTGAAVVASLSDRGGEGKRRSRVLHRLRILGIPDFALARKPSLKRGATDLSETWQVRLRVETDAALIEAAAFGATLETAALARLEARTADATDAAELTDILFDAARAGIGSLGPRLLADIRAVIQSEPSLDRLGAAMSRLLGLVLHGEIFERADKSELEDVLRVAYERAAWLFEGLTGADVVAHRGHVDAVVAMRDVLRHAGADLALDRTLTLELARRRAADGDAPSYVRGAALGLLVALDPEGAHGDAAAHAVRSASRPTSIGDFLIGVFAVAREEIRGSAAVLAAIDEAIAGMETNDFLVAVPALRQAFAFFPPREKRALAESILALRTTTQAAHDLLEMAAAPEQIAAGLALDHKVLARALAFGLLAPEEWGKP